MLNDERYLIIGQWLENEVTAKSLYWYTSIYLWLFVTGIGIPPLPEETGILYAAGVHSLHPEVWWSFAWFACGLGILSADCVLYGIGRSLGPKLFTYKWVQRILSNERRLRMESRLHAHGMKLLVLARFLPPLRTGVFLITGASRYPFLKFVIADVLYCLIGVGLFFFGGTGLLTLIKQIGYEAAWVVAIPIFGYAGYRYYRYLKLREAAPNPPVSILQSPQGSMPTGESKVNPAGAVSAAYEAEVTLQTPVMSGDDKKGDSSAA